MGTHWNQKLTKKGRAVRLSLETLTHLSEKQVGVETVDGIIRRLLGLPERKAKSNKVSQSRMVVSEYFLLTTPELAVFKDRAEARGVALLRATRMKSKPEKPRKVVEIE